MNINKIVGNTSWNLNIYEAILKRNKSYQNLEIYGIKKLFSCFDCFTKKKITHQIQNLDAWKGFQESNIATKIIMEILYLVSEFSGNSFSNSVTSSNFFSKLKNTNEAPILKQLQRHLVSSQRPASPLPNLSKVYDNFMYDHKIILLIKRFRFAMRFFPVL